MLAGEEKAVAATKTYIASLAICAQLVSRLCKNKQLMNAVTRLPQTLNEALNISWKSAIDKFRTINDTFIIGRGYGFPIAQEAALKFKETAGIQAEAFSSAEVLHGPFALVKQKKPILLFAQNDASLKGILDVAKQIKKVGGISILAAPDGILPKDEYKNAASLLLPLPKSLHPILDPIVTIQIFYSMVAELAVIRGFNPDASEHLKKITETL